jgi:hypothetical protein
MSLDTRVRDALERSSSIVDPDVRRDLATVRRKTRRSIARQRIVFALVAATMIAAAILLAPRVLDVIRTQRGQPADQPSPASQAIPGFYGAELTATDGPEIRSANLMGQWTMVVQGDGLIVLSPPVGVTRIGSNPTSYSVEGARIITTVLRSDLCSGSGPGIYWWQRSGTALTFTVQQDDCSVRVAILTARPWTLR